jgi:SNF2 family DNA or RNA helicase
MELLGYEFEKDPFPHQADTFKESAEMESYAILWEQGCGKTKIAIDNACYLYEKGEIDAVIVIAPNGVHRNWVTDELPKHVPQRLRKDIASKFWESRRSKTKGFKEELEALLRWDKFAWFFMNYDAVITETGKKFLKKFLVRRRVLYILDESHSVKTPGANRTKTIIASGKYAPYRRILSGTPISQGPFDIYSQLRFLDPEIWKRKGLHNFQMFKFHFGEWFTRKDAEQALGYDPGYDKLVRYRNIEDLKNTLSDVSSRVTKESAGLGIPEKLYSKRYYGLTKEQKALYEELVDEYIAEFEDGATIDGSLAMTRLLRLQQIICGYVKADDEDHVRLIGKKNPRLQLLKEITDGLYTPTIIWARFSPDIDQIMELLGSEAVRYDGKISDDEAEESKRIFQNNEAKFFVGNPAKGKEGLTFVNAKNVIYYSNSFKLIDRLQSEDRAHRIGQTDHVNYIDLICSGTVDEKIVKALRNKFDIATQITGDELKEWL